MKQNTFLNQPTTKQLILVLSAWFIGSVLLVLSATDLFTESFFQKDYFILYFLIAGATYTAFKVTTSYIKNLNVS